MQMKFLAASALHSMAILIAATSAVAAMPACEGTYSATSLQPLPTPVVVRADLRNQSPANVRIADRFVSGLRNAGVSVGDPANVTLYVSTSLMGGASSSRGGGGERNYQEFGALEGGVHFDVPAASERSRAPARSPMVLFLRVELTDTHAARPSWVASLQCNVTGTDDGQLAQDIGYLVGTTIGQRVDRRRF